MYIVHSAEDLQEELLKWFSQHVRHWIPWKLNENGVDHQLVKKFLLTGFGLQRLCYSKPNLRLFLDIGKNG